MFPCVNCEATYIDKEDGRTPLGNQKSGVKSNLFYTLPTPNQDKSSGGLLICSVQFHVWGTISQY